MSAIRQIKLEMLRPGPAYNQLLSPLTPYVALCGADGPVTVRLPLEQRQLLARLERLRYYSRDLAVSPRQREAELRELGEIIGRVLARVPALLSELGSVRSDSEQLVHLRLSLSAFELGMVPFETAIAPDGFPGSGSPLFLQSNTPITLTREVRRGQPLPVQWNRKPRILFLFASPAGLAPVPADRHLIALRRAIDPWVEVKDGETEQIEEVKKMLTVLPEATLEQVRLACAETDFTHVHILAHGASYESAGDRRYGLALTSSRASGEMDVVDGERLAIALTSDRAATCAAQGRPTVISLATCDSANVESVLTPGGSIAHELHAAGIPWVIASQFPLWMRASNLYAEVLYQRLLEGTDPRCVLHELRQRLRTACPETHDWASITAYATVPEGFEAQVGAFRDKQIRAGIEAHFARIDDLLEVMVTDDQGKRMAAEEEMENLSAAIRAELEAWRNDPHIAETPAEQSERWGVSAASEKRIGIAYQKQSGRESSAKTLAAYAKARNYYRKAIEIQGTNFWVITQYLSMIAVSRLAEEKNQKGRKHKAPPADLPRELGDWWSAARQICRWELPTATGDDRAYIYGTLAELELLGRIYGQDFDEAAAQEEIRRCCKEILAVRARDTFPVQSTLRQFRRYVNIWVWEGWSALAEAACDTLSDSGAVASG